MTCKLKGILGLRSLFQDILLPAVCYYNHTSSSQQEMASALHFIVVLCGLWIGADVISAHQSDGCCSNGWTKFGSRCFKVFNTPKEWADAERFCTLHGANLASILTKEEGTFIGKMIKSPTWVGGYDKVKDGVWLWSDGKEFDFNLWFPSEPNNHSGGEGCMEFFPEGVANDLKCNVPRDFICAKDA